MSPRHLDPKPYALHNPTHYPFVSTRYTHTHTHTHTNAHPAFVYNKVRAPNA
jgi:hypothetical protein